MNLGKIKGINIKLHFSTLAIVGLVGFYAAMIYAEMVQNAPLWELVLVGLINGVLILFSILIHELMHSLMALKDGIKVPEIELYIFGGVAKIEEEPKTPRSEMKIAFVGPLISLVFGGALFTLYLLPITLPQIWMVTFYYSGLTNIILGIFNLLPAFPMDGGRILRAYLWKRRNNIISATKSAVKTALFFGYGFMALGLMQTFLLGSFGGLWLVFIGFFLNNTAKRALNQTIYENWLSQLKAGDIMGLPGYAIPFDTTLMDALRRYFVPFKRSYFPVIQGPEVVGIIHIEDIKQIPYEDRYNNIVGYTMRRIGDYPEIDENDSGLDAMRMLRKIEIQPPLLIVREDDEILGFIGNEDITSAMKFADIQA